MNRCARLWVLIIAITSTLELPLAAQQQQPFRESVDVRVINIDVYVEDTAGNPVTGLSASDFEIIEDGKPQAISNFAEYRSGMFVEPAESTPAATQSVRPAETRQPRTIVFLVDAFNQRPNLREELFSRIREFMQDGLEPGDRAALFNWRQSIGTVVPLTTDLREIDVALAAMGGIQLPSEDQTVEGVVEFLEDAVAFEQELGDAGASSSLAAQMETTIRNCAEEYLSEMENKSIALRGMVDSLAGLEGRKILVYVAGRFPADTATYCQSILRTPEMGPPNFTFRAGTYSTDHFVEHVTTAANAAGVTFYPIRPRTSARGKTSVEYTTESSIGASEELGDTLVVMNDADALATLADKTGGRLAVGDHMARELLAEIISDLDNYYSIGYRATSDGGDRRRNLNIRMKDRGLRARARDAFVEKSRLSQIKDQLIANLVGEPRAGDIELDVIVGQAVPGKRGRSTLPVEVRIPLDQLVYEGQKPTSDVRLFSAAGTTPGSTTEISETVKRIEKPPADLEAPFITWKVDLVMSEGGTKIAFAVLDEVSGLAGFATVDRTTESIERAQAEALASLNEWERTLQRAHWKEKPLLVYFRPEPCYVRSVFSKIPVCEQFESDVLAHPEIVRRLQNFELIHWKPSSPPTLTAAEVIDCARPRPFDFGASAERICESQEKGLPAWPKDKAGLALMRIDGQPIARWSELPNGANFARVLDGLAPHAGELVQVNELIRLDRIDEADLAIATLKIQFGLRDEGLEILDRLASESRILGEIATVRLAYLDTAENKSRGLAELRVLTGRLHDPIAIGDAWLAIAALTSNGERIAALKAALAASPKGSSQRTIAETELANLAAPAQENAIIRIAPVPIATGRTELRTIVQSARVDSVEFFLDRRPVSKDDSAPFRAIIRLERLPTRHEVRVVARDSSGAILGEDSLTLNGRSDTLWVRFISPETETASGETDVEVVLQIPEGESPASVEIDHDGKLYPVDGPPYRITVPVAPDQISVLQARVALAGGTTAEDTKILNAPGLSETAGVHLVELPLVPMQDQPLLLENISLIESGKVRQVEALIGADVAPLTLGLVIDVSGSMTERSLDVQSAAAALIEQVLRPQDQGFLVSFDSEARVEVGVTQDKGELIRKVRALSPAGSTALFDAMMLGLLQYEPLGGRRALVVFSDGDDSVSRYRPEEVAEVSRRAGIPIYLVRAHSEEENLAPQLSMPTLRSLRSSSENAFQSRKRQARLDRMTRESGGDFFQLDSLGSIEEIFSNIGRLVSRQMLLTYFTETSDDEEWRTVEVRLNGKGAVRAPQGYYARPH